MNFAMDCSHIVPSSCVTCLVVSWPGHLAPNSKRSGGYMLTEQETLWLNQSSPIWLGTPLKLGSSAKLDGSMRLGNVIELEALLNLLDRKYDEIESVDDPADTFFTVVKSMLTRLQEPEDKTAFDAAVIERYIGE